MRTEETIYTQLNRCTPENITLLEPNEVLVFGSKPNGHHKGGAAKIAKEKFGAIEGVGEGLRGQSYAIPVHKHHTGLMESAIMRFINYAISHRDLIFYVLPIGCVSAGLDYKLVANMFRSARDLPNVFLPPKFYSFLFSFDKHILLTYKNIDNGIELVGDISQFFECDGVSICQYDGTELILPTTIAGQPIKKIGIMAFEQECGMPSLPIYWKALIIPEGVEVISHRAFSYNPDIETLILPDSLKEVHSWAFSNCANLKNVLFGKNVVRVNASAFSGCPEIVFYTTGGEDIEMLIQDYSLNELNDFSITAKSILKETFVERFYSPFVFSDKELPQSAGGCNPYLQRVANIEREIERHKEYQSFLRRKLFSGYMPMHQIEQRHKQNTTESNFNIEFCARQILNDEASVLRLQQLLNNIEYYTDERPVS